MSSSTNTKNVNKTRAPPTNTNNVNKTRAPPTNTNNVNTENENKRCKIFNKVLNMNWDYVRGKKKPKGK